MINASCLFNKYYKSNMLYIIHVSVENKGIGNKKYRIVVEGERASIEPQLQLPNDARWLPNYSVCCIYVFSFADSDVLLRNLLNAFVEISHTTNELKC